MSPQIFGLVILPKIPTSSHFTTVFPIPVSFACNLLFSLWKFFKGRKQAKTRQNLGDLISYEVIDRLLIRILYHLLYWKLGGGVSPVCTFVFLSWDIFFPKVFVPFINLVHGFFHSLYYLFICVYRVWKSEDNLECVLSSHHWCSRDGIQVIRLDGFYYLARLTLLFSATLPVTVTWFSC